MAIVPMFPLGSVLLPTGVLTLHVFEPRYVAMVQHCVASDDHEFGVVLIDRGFEVGGGDVRREIGTIARMVQVAELGDDRLAVVAVGVERVRATAWLSDDPYPRADVEPWPDDESEPEDAGLVRAVAQRARRAAAAAIELGDPAPDPSVELAADLLTASYQLAHLAPIGPADAYDLLCAAGPMTRVRALGRMLDDVEATQAFRLQNP